MKKLKAIWRILYSDHFYLVNANSELQTEELWYTCDKDDYIISAMIHLYWEAFWKGIFLTKQSN